MGIPNLDAFQVIADPSRRQILQMLTTDSYNINGLADKFDMSRPAVSKHISILYSAGFININEIGRERYCSLNEKGFVELRNWINHFDKFWSSKLKSLEVALNNKSKNKPNQNKRK